VDAGHRRDLGARANRRTDRAAPDGHLRLTFVPEPGTTLLLLAAATAAMVTRRRND
jgi:hypothetical protein